MPIYEYSCRGCDAAFETLILRRSDEAEVECPTCGSRKVGRLMSRPAAARGGRAGSSSGGPPPNCGPIG
jgi:putative FmdB family regulatory protein